MNGIHVAAEGRISADPELKLTSTGKSVLQFSIPVSENHPDGTVETTWLRVTLWDDRANQCSGTLKKGDEVYIEGKLKLSEWTTQDGLRRSGLSVSAWTCEVLGAIGHRAPRQPSATTTKSQLNTEAALALIPKTS